MAVLGVYIVSVERRVGDEEWMTILTAQFVFLAIFVEEAPSASLGHVWDCGHVIEGREGVCGRVV